MLLALNPHNPQKRHIQTIVDTLENEGVIIYPTDTSYCFGCSINSKKAMERIYRLKNIDQKQPLTFICKDFSHFQEYSKPLSTQVYRAVKQQIPGAYTFILSASKLVPKVMLSKRKTIGVRVPDATIAAAITSALDLPLLSSSVPMSDESLPQEPYELYEEYKKVVDIVVDGGTLNSLQSAVIDFSGDGIEILREGAPPQDLSWLP